MPLVEKLNKKQVKELFKKIKKQQIKLPDNSTLTVKIKPSFFNLKKTSVSLKWDKSVDNVDFSIVVNGQPVRIISEGIHQSDDDYFRAEGQVTFKF